MHNVLLSQARGVILALDAANILQNAGNSTSSTFDPLVNKVQDVGNGGYRIVYMAMLFLFIIGFVIAMIKLFFSNGATRQDSKSDIIWKVVAAIGGFGIVSLVILLSGVGATLFN